MADDSTDKRHRGKKKKSSLHTWKKKFNIKKRFQNKLPLHRRHIRNLMSGWSIHEIKSVLMQYEITSMLKELCLLADRSQPPASTLQEDLLRMYRTSSCCSMVISCCEMTESQCVLMHDTVASHKQFKVHKMLVSSRWPYLNDIINEKIANIGSVSFYGNHMNLASDELPYGSRYDFDIANWSIHINGLSEDKLRNILLEIYNGNVNINQHSSPRKLLPLPTTDDSLHIRNSRGNKQHFRYTTFECEPPAVSRRRSGSRRKHKHRFSMDERILSKQHFPSSKVHRVSPSKSNDFVLNSGLSCQDEFRHLSFENPYLRRQGKTVIPNSLNDDLLKMYHETKSGLGDLKLIVGVDLPQWMNQKDDIIYCHRLVLAARSPYFKRLLENQSIPSTNQDSQPFVQTLEIDGSIIPSKWMSTVLYTMYTDKIHFLDLSQRVAHDMAMNNPLFNIEDAIILHQIANFIEFPTLIHGCEELIVQHLDERNFYRVLQWSSLPHGSSWVRRQVNIFIRDRFTELNAPQLVEVLRSDFVNASELDILKCVLKWGEQELGRRIEETEPNLLTHTTHSISRNKTDSARRREVLYSRIDDLHECTAPVLACVRTQHLLPPNHEIFANAVKRGVISRPPTDLLESVTDKENGSRQWVKSRAGFVPPRLFQPYMDETKNILDDTYAQESDCVNLRSMHSLSQDATWGSMRHRYELSSHGIPDTLYMVGQSKVPTRRRYGNRDLHLNFMQQRVEPHKQKIELKKFMGNFYPVPDISVVRDLIGRERELRASRIVNRILMSCTDCCHSNSSGFNVVSYAGRLSIPQADVNQSHEDLDETEHCNRCTALRLLRLHVVREHGLPDCAVDLLQHPETYYTLSELRGVTVTDTTSGTDFNYKETMSDVAKRDVRRTATTRSSHEPGIPYGNCRNKQNAAYPDDSSLSWDKENEIAHSNGLNSQCVFVNLSTCQRKLSSSSEDELILRRRRKSARKGSSSTTSHQSIPDVAASANSSLQRLRDSGRNIATQIQDPAFVESPSSQPSTDRRSTLLSYYDTETCESSQSSCDDETTGNKQDFTPDHTANVDYQTCSENAMNHISRKPRHIANAGYVKSHSARRPVSTDMSELFSKTLDFTDEQSDSGDDTFMHLLPPKNQVIFHHGAESLVHDIPEIVRDGTPPCSRAVNAASKRSPHRQKPDIYPSSELRSDLTMECGQYFLHSKDSLLRGKHSGVGGCKSARLLSVGMLDSKLSPHEMENDSLDNDTIFL